MRILETLSRLPVILFSFLAMMIIGASFGYFQQFVGGKLLDMSMSGPDALNRLTEMSASHKQAHTWITLITDSLYPIAYGSFFAGATLKLAGLSNRKLVVPTLVTVIADFFENTAQILALNGHENLIMAKSFFTPIKFSAFVIMNLIFLFYVLMVIGKIIVRKINYPN